MDITLRLFEFPDEEHIESELIYMCSLSNSKSNMKSFIKAIILFLYITIILFLRYEVM